MPNKLPFKPEFDGTTIAFFDNTQQFTSNGGNNRVLTEFDNTSIKITLQYVLDTTEYLTFTTFIANNETTTFLVDLILICGEILEYEVNIVADSLSLIAQRGDMHRVELSYITSPDFAYMNCYLELVPIEECYGGSHYPHLNALLGFPSSLPW